MDWCVDPRVPDALDHAEAEIVAHLRRHAAAPETVDLARAIVHDALSAGNGAMRWVTLDWEEPEARLSVRAMTPNSWPGPGPRGRGLVPLRPGVALAHQALADLATVAAESTTVPLPVVRPAEPDCDPPGVDAVDGDLTRETFLATVASALSRAAESDRSQDQLAAWAGASVGQGAEHAYGRGHDERSPDAREVARIFVELQRDAGGDFFVVEADERRAVLGNRRCPFGTGVVGSPGLCRTTSAAIGTLAAHRAGEARVTLDERIALGDDQCRLILDLGPAAERPTSHRYTSPPSGWEPREDSEPVPVPQGFHVALSLRLPRDRLSVPIVRHLIHDALDEVGVVADDASDVELALAEACGNVLTHSGPGDAYDVSVTIAPTQCDIRIIDIGHGFDFRSLSDQMSPSDAESGRGIALMKAVMDQVRFLSEPERGTIVHLVKRLRFDDSVPARRLMLENLASDDDADRTR
jgi:anti-sigma regulatory factor (Ser/Thr protein kinase)